MFDKFLKRVEKISESEDKSIMKKDEGVTNNKNFTPSSTTINSLNPDFVGFKPFDPEFKYNKGFNANGKSFGKKGINGKKFNSYNKLYVSNSFKKEYVDDGSYFCSYATGGNTVVCYKNNQKMEFLLWEIEHPDKNHFLAKRANYFLNNLVKKQKIIIKEKENNLVEIFLIDNPNLSINSLMIAEGFHSSVPYNEKTNKVNPFDKYKNKTKNEDDNENSSIEDSTKINESLKKEKKNFAYGLFAKSSDTFEALFDNKKITCKLHNLDISIYDDAVQKKIKNIIYEFVSKKSIILDFKNEEKDPFIVTVSNKDGEVLNDIILSKNFNKIILDDNNNNNSVKSNNSNLNLDDNCVESDWDWVEKDDSTEVNSKIENSNNTNEIDVPETSVIPKMFQNKSKSNSPFSRIKKGDSNANITTQATEINDFSDINIVDDNLIENNEQSNDLSEIDIPETSVIPKMFQNKSRTNSPFSRIKKGESNENTITQATEITNSNNLQVQPQKNKLSFGKR